MVLALPELIAYALLFLALALAFASRKITQALLGGLIAALQAIPLIGGKLASPLRAVESAIVGACESIETGIDNLMGLVWHNTARLLDWTWREIRSHAASIAAIAPLVGTGLSLYHGVRAIVRHLEQVWHGIEHGVRTLTREYHGLERQVHQLEHDLAKGIGADVLPQIRSLDHELHKVTTQVIPAIESGVATAEHDVTALGEYVRANYLSNATDVIAAAVAVALGALGLGGLRCNSLLNSLKNRGCGLWSGLEDLLGLLVDVSLFASVCEVLDFLSPFVSEVAAPAVTELTAAGAGLCSGGIGAPPALPPVTLSLPANPSITLNLP